MDAKKRTPARQQHSGGSVRWLPANIFETAAGAVFIVCCLYFIVHWFAYRDGAQTRDFVAPYAGARCMWTGCNPYDTGQIEHAFLAAGGLLSDHPDWRWEPAIYPPSTLVELLPFSLLLYHAARLLWYGCNALLVCAAMGTMAMFLRSPYRAWALLAGALTLTSEPVALLFNIGQPSGAAIGLSVLALWLLLRTRHQAVGTVCLALALGLKPQLAGLVWIALIARRSSRPAAIKAGTMAIVVLLLGVAWVSHASAGERWFADYRQQMTSSLQPGGINDPSVRNYGSEQFTNLQTIFALVDVRPAVYNAMSYAVAAVLLACWAWGARRQQDEATALWTKMAALVCIGLLPVYHREYDCVLLVLTWPALAMLVARRSWFAVPTLAGTAWLLMTAPRYHRHWFAHLQHAAWLNPPKLRIAVFQYPQPLLLLVLSCVYLVMMFSEGNRARSAAGS